MNETTLWWNHICKREYFGFQEICERRVLTEENTIFEKSHALSWGETKLKRHKWSKCSVERSELDGTTDQRFRIRLLLSWRIEEKVNRPVQIDGQTPSEEPSKGSFLSSVRRIRQRRSWACLHSCTMICVAIRRFNLIKCYKCKLILSSEESCNSCTLRSSPSIKILLPAPRSSKSNNLHRSKMLVLNEQKAHQRL